MTTSQRRWRMHFPRPRTTTATLAIGLALAGVATTPAISSAAHFTDEKALDANSATVWRMQAPVAAFAWYDKKWHMYADVEGPFSEEWARIAGIQPADLDVESPNCGSLALTWVSLDGGVTFNGGLDMTPQPAGTICELQFTYKQWRSPVTTITVTY